MTKTQSLALASIIVAMALAAPALVRSAAAADQPPLLTSDELKKLVDSGQYRDALKAMIRILDLKGAAAAAYDRHDLLMLRAECQLQIKDTPDALETLKIAQKEAAEKSDDAHVSQALAMALLIQKSPGLNYTPRTGKVRKPIPILDRVLRKAAYDALFADEVAPLELKSKAALKAKSLVPIAEAAKNIAGIRAVEFVSTGDNKQTAQMTVDLTKQALKLLTDTIDDFSAKTDRINTSANRVITDNVTVMDAAGHAYNQVQTHRKGLTSQEVQTLKSIKADCEKIPVAASELAQGLGGDAAPFKAVAAKADAVKDKATSTLTDDYTSALH